MEIVTDILLLLSGSIFYQKIRYYEKSSVFPIRLFPDSHPQIE